MLCLPEDGGAGDGESCIFFKLSNSGLELGIGTGREAGEAAGPTAAGRVNVNGGLAAGGVSVAEVEASSEERQVSYMGVPE